MMLSHFAIVAFLLSQDSIFLAQVFVWKVCLEKLTMRKTCS